MGWEYIEKFCDLPEGAQFVILGPMWRGIWTKVNGKATDEKGKSTDDLIQNARVSWVESDGKDGWKYARPNYHEWSSSKRLGRI